MPNEDELSYHVPKTGSVRQQMWVNGELVSDVVVQNVPLWLLAQEGEDA